LSVNAITIAVCLIIWISLFMNLAFRKSNFHIIILFLLFSSGRPLVITGQSKGGIVEYNTFVSISGNNLIEEETYLILVGDKLSDWLSDITIPYNKSEKLEIVEASVINSAGIVVRKLGKKEIVTRSDISRGALFEDDYAKEFNLRWHEFPYRIRYTYRKTSNRFIYISAWSPVVYSDVPTLKASLTVKLPLSYKYKTYSSGALKFSRDSSNGVQQLKWEADSVYPLRKEPYAPPYQDIVPRVFIAPQSFVYGIPGRLDSWETLGKWQDRINSSLLDLTWQERFRIDSILAGTKEKIEIARRLYHYMQDNTRYINVSIDIGGLQPYPASYVCNNKYGDCKALTIYMMALLKYAGIESFYSVISAGSNPVGIIKEFPAPQFNHVILCLPAGKDTIWLENTSNLLPFGYLGSFTQNRYCLVVNGENSKLIKTPALGINDVGVRSFYLFRHVESGKTKVEIKREMKGPEFEAALELGNDLKDDKRKAYIRNQGQLNGDVISCSFHRSDRDQTSLFIDSEIEIENSLRRISNSLIFNYVPLKLISLEKPAERKYPVKINYPVNHIDSVVVDLSLLSGYEIQVPEDSFFSSEYGRYSVNYTRGEGKITAVWKFQLFSNLYDKDKYKGLFDFIESIKLSIKKSPIILTSKK
jgi:hypothetical protein